LASDRPSKQEVARSEPSPPAPLFRQEVFLARERSQLGAVLLAPSVTHRFFAIFAALTASAVLAFLVLGEYTRRERVSGWLVPEGGMARVVPPRTGVITGVHVKDGDLVDQGARLVTLSAEVHSEAIGSTQMEIVSRLEARRASLVSEHSLQTRLSEQEVAGQDQRIATLQAEERQIAEEIELQRRQTRLARRSADRLRPLADERLVSAVEMDSADREGLEQELELKSLERQLTAATRARVSLEADREILPLKNETRLAAIDREVAEIDQELAAAEAAREIVLTAGQPGVVTALRAEIGSAAGTTMPLLSIVPKDSVLQAQLFAPGASVGFLKEGQKVLLRYRAFPFQKFGHYKGTVAAVARAAINPKELGAPLEGLTNLVRGEEPVYIVTVRLERQTVAAYGKSVALQPGMQVHADVMLESRRLIEWVFEPLLTLAGKQSA
jgi:membrane fusion protein